MAVIARRRAMRLEKGAALAVGGEIAGPTCPILAGQQAELRDIVAKAWEMWIDDGIRPVGGDDAPAPARCADHRVPSEIVERAFGGGENFDVEFLEQNARPEFRPLQGLRDRVVIGVGIVGAKTLFKAEQGLE